MTRTAASTNTEIHGVIPAEQRPWSKTRSCPITKLPKPAYPYHDARVPITSSPPGSCPSARHTWPAPSTPHPCTPVPKRQQLAPQQPDSKIKQGQKKRLTFFSSSGSALHSLASSALALVAAPSRSPAAHRSLTKSEYALEGRLGTRSSEILRCVLSVLRPRAARARLASRTCAGV